MVVTTDPFLVQVDDLLRAMHVAVNDPVDFAEVSYADRCDQPAVEACLHVASA